MIECDVSGKSEFVTIQVPNLSLKFNLKELDSY